MRLNTLEASKQLQNVGVEESHADAFVKLVYDAEEQLATKADIDGLRLEINQSRSENKSEINQFRSETKVEFDLVRSEINQLRSETKSEIDRLRSETKSEFELVRSEINQLRSDTKVENNQLRSDFANLKSDIIWLKWLAGIQVALLLGGVSVNVTFAN